MLVLSRQEGEACVFPVNDSVMYVVRVKTIKPKRVVLKLSKESADDVVDRTVTLRLEEAVELLDHPVQVIVVAIHGEKVRLGFEFPLEISGYREEVYEAIVREKQKHSQNEGTAERSAVEVRQSGLESVFPGDFAGRVACVLIGLVFGGIGSAVLAALLLRPAGLRMLPAYELAAASTIFGVALVTWGLFKPHWILEAGHHIATHFMLALMILSLPILLKGLWAILIVGA